MKIYAIAVTIAAVLCFGKWILYKLNFIALLGYCDDKNTVPTNEEMNFYFNSLVKHYMKKILGKKYLDK